MSETNDDAPRHGRREFLARLALLAAAAPLAAAGAAAEAPSAEAGAAPAPAGGGAEPFWGPHQGGITTPIQAHTSFLSFDLTATKRSDVADLLRRWTDAAAEMTAGRPAKPLGADGSEAPADSGDALGLPPSRLTLTFGLGAGLFVKDGQDRYGLAKKRPEALIDLPRFNGDQLVEARTGGDLSVQACADDPQVAFHAVRQLSRLAYGAAQIRWAQNGFVPGYKPGETGRNLMGFKDGTMNPPTRDGGLMAKHVWVGDEGPVWMRGGSYMVIRPTRIALEHWDRMKLAFQEQTVGRHKYSGAPIGRKEEREPLDLDAVDADGNPLVPENSHARLAAPQNNDGAQILRRAYSYDNGVSFTAERWPPWHQGMEFDAGLLFQCYQRDPRAGFVKIFDKMSKFDMMNQFVTHVGSGLFACPAGAAEGEFVGQRLFA
jgi:deferrochelatase/peroxidase EfeB